MFEFHIDRKRYFEMQVWNAGQYVIPFIEEKFPIRPGMRVLEIGCGEGGVLKAFVDKGCTGTGVELDTPRIETGSQYLEKEIQEGRIRFVGKDIYQVDIQQDFGGGFDIIVLKDVIEHIFDQAKLIGWMKNFLNPGGVVFFGFPPWYMPFGGHQQIWTSWIGRMPYIHLLPAGIYRWLLKQSPKADEKGVREMMEIKETGISIERFERICQKEGYEIVHDRHYLINPIYKWKFGWKARRQGSVIKAIPFIRNFFTTCVYYLIKVK